MARLAEIGPGAVHVAVDVQRLFSEPAGWRVPDLPLIVPRIVDVIRAKPGRTLFTRFTVPRSAQDAHGAWRPYYEYWSDFIGERLSPGLIDLVDDLASLADSSGIFDKPTYSAFEAPEFSRALARLNTDTIIFSGVETDVCVLATLLTAVDRGYRVIALEDALASSSPEGHAATLRHVLPRFDRQVEITTTAALIAAWT